MKVKLYQNREWLFNEYVTLNKSMWNIADEQGVDCVTILNWLKRFNITRRTRGEGCHLARGNHVSLTFQIIEVINGLMLGDGHLNQRSKWSAGYEHGSKYKEYLEWLSERFNGFGVKQTGKIYKETIDKRPKWKNAIGYRYSSLSYSELLPLQQKWYRLYSQETDPPNWSYKLIKIVPRDIELTPTTCLYWYMDDGCLKHRSKKNSNDNINLATMGFPIADIEFLVRKLNEIGFKCHRTVDNQIYISTESTPAFLEYIGDCPVDCYKYKWKLKNLSLFHFGNN